MRVSDKVGVGSNLLVYPAVRRSERYCERDAFCGEHAESVRKMKEALAATPALRKAVYGKEVPIYVVVEKAVPRRNRRIMCAN